MPKASRTKAQKWKKRRRSWGGRYAGLQRVPSRRSPLRYLTTLPIGGIPKVKYVKLRHVAQMSLDPASNSYAKQTVNLSNPMNIFDEKSNPSVVGNFSTHIQSYEKWTVVAAKVTLRYYPIGSNNTQDLQVPSYLGIYIDDNTTDFDNVISNGPEGIMEQPRNTTCKAIPFLGGSAQAECTMSRQCDIAKFFSISDTGLYDDDVYSGSNQSTHPIKNVYATIWSCSMNGNNPGKLNYLAIVDYVIRFSEPSAARTV